MPTRQIGSEIDSVTGNQVQQQVESTTAMGNFFKNSDGSFKWLNIGGTLIAITALGFGVRFIVKKFTK